VYGLQNENGGGSELVGLHQDCVLGKRDGALGAMFGRVLCCSEVGKQQGPCQNEVIAAAAAAAVAAAAAGAGAAGVVRGPGRKV
jgi:hypothetical protein